MINPRSNFGIEVLDGTVVAVGGFNGFQATGGREDYLFFTCGQLDVIFYC